MRLCHGGLRDTEAWSDPYTSGMSTRHGSHLLNANQQAGLGDFGSCRWLTCSCMRAYDSAMRTTASNWRTVIGTTGVSLSFSLAAARACRPHTPVLSTLNTLTTFQNL